MKKIYSVFTGTGSYVPTKQIKNDFFHSPDYASVTWKGNQYTFSPLQAAAIKYLHEAYQNGTPDCNQASLLVEIGSNSNQVWHVFKDKKQGQKAWNDGLIISTRKGIFRINL